MQKKILWHSKHLELDITNDKLLEVDDKLAEYEDDEMMGQFFTPPTKKIAAMPFGGFIELDESLHPLKNFKFYLAHTNFNITKRTIMTLLDVEGIEVLQPVTRYRFLIAIGELFDVTSVKLDIEYKLCGRDITESKTSFINNDAIRETAQHVIKELNTLDVEWTICVFPNGNIDFAVNTDQYHNQYIKDVKEFEECVKNAGCRIICSS
jgi:hypothetical protein